MKRILIATSASLVILVAGVFLWRTLWPTSQKFDPTVSIGVGQVLAEEVAKVVHDRGSVVAVIAGTHLEPVGAGHNEWETFRAELKKHPAVNLVATEVDPPNTDGLPGCSSAALREILERHAQVDAIVFFMPLPPWGWLQTHGGISSAVTPKLIVMGGTTDAPKNHYAGYFVHGILAGLILQQPGHRPEQIANPRTPRERFQNEYQIFTPANYELLVE